MKFVPSDKGIKKTDFNRDEIYQKNNGVHPFSPQTERRNSGTVESRIVNEKLRRYKSKWLRQVTRMNNRMPKIMLNCRSIGRRRLRRSLKWPLDKTDTGLLKRNS